MTDTTTYFGNAVPATYPDGSPIIVNGRPLLIPEKNYSLQQQIDAARYQASRGLAAGFLTREWFLQHFPAGSSGDPQRQAGWSGGFDARYTDAGNYGYGLSAAAAGISQDTALKMAAEVNQIGTGKPLPAVNERAIRQGYTDYTANLFPKGDVEAGRAYAGPRAKIPAGFLFCGSVRFDRAFIRAGTDPSHLARHHLRRPVAAKLSKSLDRWPVLTMFTLCSNFFR
jgi:hypothetical protein